MREKEKKETEITQSITHVYKIYDGEREKNANKLVNMARENNGKKMIQNTFTRSPTYAVTHVYSFNRCCLLAHAMNNMNEKREV